MNEYLSEILNKYAENSSVIVEIGPGNGDLTNILVMGLEKSNSNNKLMITIESLDRIIKKPQNAFWKYLIADSTSKKLSEKIHYLLDDKIVDLVFINTMSGYKQKIKEFENISGFTDLSTTWLINNPNEETLQVSLEFARINNMKCLQIQQNGCNLIVIMTSKMFI